MWQNRKYYAKNDPILLADLTPEALANTDSFKVRQAPLPKAKEVSSKALTVNYLPAGNMKIKHPVKGNPRWTEVQVRFGVGQNRLFDNIQPMPAL